MPRTADCQHKDGFIPGGGPDFGGPLGAQNMCCRTCGASKRQIEDDRLFRLHIAHVRAGIQWSAKCAWCPENEQP